jgi:DEAD/DEAH box helicase domain-containing protein
MSGEVVFDIETYGDIRNRDEVKVTVVSVYEYATDSYRSFEESELSSLWPILEKADRIIGYNSKGFDAPILAKYYAGNINAIPHLDLLEKIKESTGKRFKLDDVAKATLNMSKSADGLIAMKWYEQGEMQKIKDYCEQDVKVTKEIYEFGKKNKMLYTSTLTGELMPITVNFDPQPMTKGPGQVGSGINMTLPF